MKNACSTIYFCACLLTYMSGAFSCKEETDVKVDEAKPPPNWGKNNVPSLENVK